MQEDYYPEYDEIQHEDEYQEVDQVTSETTPASPQTIKTVRTEDMEWEMERLRTENSALRHVVTHPKSSHTNINYDMHTTQQLKSVKTYTEPDNKNIQATVNNNKANHLINTTYKAVIDGDCMINRITIIRACPTQRKTSEETIFIPKPC